MTDHHDLLDAPCVFCGYNGAGYWQSGTHADGCPWQYVGGGEERREQLPTVMRLLVQRCKDLARINAKLFEDMAKADLRLNP